MDFSEKIAALSKKVKNMGDGIKTEEATQNACHAVYCVLGV